MPLIHLFPPEISSVFPLIYCKTPFMSVLQHTTREREEGRIKIIVLLDCITKGCKAEHNFEWLVAFMKVLLLNKYILLILNEWLGSILLPSHCYFRIILFSIIVFIIILSCLFFRLEYFRIFLFYKTVNFCF